MTLDDLIVSEPNAISRSTVSYKGEQIGLIERRPFGSWYYYTGTWKGAYTTKDEALQALILTVAD